MISLRHCHLGPAYLPRGTLAIVCPNKRQLLEAFATGAGCWAFHIGLSICHPKDQFNKSHGSAIASNRLRTRPCVFKKMERIGIRFRYYFDADLQEGAPHYDHQISKVQFILSTIPDSDNVHLEYFTFKE